MAKYQGKEIKEGEEIVLQIKPVEEEMEPEAINPNFQSVEDEEKDSESIETSGDQMIEEEFVEPPKVEVSVPETPLEPSVPERPTPRIKPPKPQKQRPAITAEKIPTKAVAPAKTFTPEVAKIQTKPNYQVEQAPLQKPVIQSVAQPVSQPIPKPSVQSTLPPERNTQSVQQTEKLPVTIKPSMKGVQQSGKMIIGCLGILFLSFIVLLIVASVMIFQLL